MPSGPGVGCYKDTLTERPAPWRLAAPKAVEHQAQDWPDCPSCPPTGPCIPRGGGGVRRGLCRRRRDCHGCQAPVLTFSESPHAVSGAQRAGHSGRSQEGRVWGSDVWPGAGYSRDIRGLLVSGDTACRWATSTVEGGVPSVEGAWRGLGWGPSFGAAARALSAPAALRKATQHGPAVGFVSHVYLLGPCWARGQPCPLCSLQQPRDGRVRAQPVPCGRRRQPR